MLKLLSKSREVPAPRPLAGVSPEGMARAFGEMLVRVHGDHASQLADLVVASVQDAMRRCNDN